MQRSTGLTRRGLAVAGVALCLATSPPRPILVASDDVDVGNLPLDQSSLVFAQTVEVDLSDEMEAIADELSWALGLGIDPQLVHDGVLHLAVLDEAWTNEGIPASGDIIEEATVQLRSGAGGGDDSGDTASGAADDTAGDTGGGGVARVALQVPIRPEGDSVFHIAAWVSDGGAIVGPAQLSVTASDTPGGCRDPGVDTDGATVELEVPSAG